MVNDEYAGVASSFSSFGQQPNHPAVPGWFP
jgi:hypothetical protein